VKQSNNNRFTFLIIPGSAAGTKKISLPIAAARALLIGLIAVAVVILCAGVNYWHARQDLANIRNIMRDNEQKTKEIKDLGQKLIELQQQNARINEQQNEIKKVIGGQSTTSSAGHEQPSRGQLGLNRFANLETGEQMIREAGFLSIMLNIEEAETQKLLDLALSKAQVFRALPNLWPVRGKITSLFGWRDNPFGRSRKREFHDGLDIAVPYGTPVRAAGDGVVIYAAWKSGYGRLIKIQHANGLVSWYGHNSKLLAQEGDTVKKGEIISNVGSSGRSTGPHLHFGIEKQGKLQDPLNYLP
jgi:murein DD-endopeptidase MepM/ murein hydrolase activator NlpD